MSALPAQITETIPGADAPAPGAVPRSRATLMSARRSAKRAARRSRRRWAIGSCLALLACFALTVGIVGVLR